MFGSVVGAFGRVSVRISVRQASFKLMMSAQHHNEWNRSELPVDMNIFGLFETGAITYHPIFKKRYATSPLPMASH